MMLNSYRLIKQSLLIGGLLIGGCVSIPQSIQSISPTPISSLNEVKAVPELYIGKEGRFGGKVISVQTDNQSTRLEIVVMPLSQYNASPVLNSVSLGRIYAYVDRFIDPTDFLNQYVTVVGTIKGARAGKIDYADYQFVELMVTGLQRWHPVERIVTPPGGFWGYEYGRYPGYYGWGWEPGLFMDTAPFETYLIP